MLTRNAFQRFCLWLVLDGPPLGRFARLFFDWGMGRRGLQISEAEANLPFPDQRGELYAPALAAARTRLLAAGFSPHMPEWVCDQAAIDYPGWGEDWARAVEGDVEALCTDPTSFDDGGPK